jgi:hypothetical protein
MDPDITHNNSKMQNLYQRILKHCTERNCHCGNAVFLGEGIENTFLKLTCLKNYIRLEI